MTPALSLYLLAAARAETFIRRRAPPPDVAAEDRRSLDGVLWIHLSAGQPPEAATTLVWKLAEERPETHCIVTSDEADGAASLLPRPPDFPTAAGDFLTRWKPGVGVWIGGPIRPVLAACASRAGVPLILANATAAEAARHRGLPARDLLGLFHSIVACSASDGEALERASSKAPAVLGPLQSSGRPLDHDEREYRRVSDALNARPLWFAARVTRPEVGMLRQAHAVGQGASHRLLMIVEPADADTAAACILAFGACRSALGTPPAGAAAFVADIPDEAGLWYRLASVSLIGGSIVGPQAMADPYAPAALGSAVLHGPNEAPFEAHFKTLRAASASRLVPGPNRLGQAVVDMLAPDLTATLAHRAWSVVSSGAEATDHVTETAIRLLDGAD